VAFAFAIAANVVAAVASLLTGRRRRAVAGQESLGFELAAVAAEGGIEPSELVPDAGSEGQASSEEPRTNGEEPGTNGGEPGTNGPPPAITEVGGQSPAITEAITESGGNRPG
jgi:hypothetical protein